MFKPLDDLSFALDQAEYADAEARDPGRAAPGGRVTELFFLDFITADHALRNAVQHFSTDFCRR